MGMLIWLSCFDMSSKDYWGWRQLLRCKRWVFILSFNCGSEGPVSRFGDIPYMNLKNRRIHQWLVGHWSRLGEFTIFKFLPKWFHPPSLGFQSHRLNHQPLAANRQDRDKDKDKAKLGESEFVVVVRILRRITNSLLPEKMMLKIWTSSSWSWESNWKTIVVLIFYLH